MSPGIVIMPACTLPHEQTSGGGDGARVAVARAFRDDARAIAHRKRCCGGVDRDDEHAGERLHLAYGVEHILEHGRREHATLLRA